MINRNEILGLVSDLAYKKASDTTPKLLSGIKCSKGRAIYLSRIVVRNKTHTSTSFTLYVEDGGLLKPLSYQASPALTEIYTITTGVWLRDGQRIEVDYVGATASDEIELMLYGEEYEFNDVMDFKGTKEKAVK